MTPLETILFVLFTLALAAAFVFWHFSRVYHYAAGGNLKPVHRGGVSWMVVVSCEIHGDLAFYELSPDATESDVREVAAKVYFAYRENSPTVRAFRAFELPVAIEIAGEMSDVALEDEVKA